MTDIEYQGDKTRWKLSLIHPKQMYQNMTRLRVPVIRYRGVTIWRSLSQWVVIHKRWEEINGIERQLIYVIENPNLKRIKQMIDILLDPKISQQTAKVLVNHVDRAHLKNYLQANETVTNQERQVGLLEIKFNEVDDENAQ